MPKTGATKPVIARARSWATKHGLFGPSAFLRYVILTYLEALNEVSRDFIFKGGNLLWTYIHTPRSTVDLDLATTHLGTHEEVKAVLEDACEESQEITFAIKKFTPLETHEKSGATVVIHYCTPEGANNTFEIDIVYELPTDIKEIASPLTDSIKIPAASIENIIADKLAALHRYARGNTRVKDPRNFQLVRGGGLGFRSSHVRARPAARAPSRPASGHPAQSAVHRSPIHGLSSPPRRYKMLRVLLIVVHHTPPTSQQGERRLYKRVAWRRRAGQG